MPAILSPNAKQQFFTDGSTVAAGFKLYTYAANTVTPQTTYMNRAGTVANTNPIILDARGEATIYLTPGVVYDYVLKTDQDVTVWTREDVTADAGDANAVTFLQAGTGAVSRTSQDKLRERVSAADFGAVEDGVSNDSAALQAAIDSIGAGGGVVTVKGKLLLTNGLTIKPGVTIRGELSRPGVPGTSNSDASNIWDLESTLLVPSTQTITMEGSSCIDGVVVRRSTMSAPENSAAAYAGTAITAGGEDVCVRNCLVVGFNKFFLSVGFQRINISYTNFDCVNGVDITDCFDTTRIDNVHGWPFGTIDASAPVTTFDTTHFLFRNGTAFKLSGGNDWTKLTECFSYGYMTGYLVDGPANVILSGCGADNISAGDNVIPNSSGFFVSGVTEEITLSTCQTAAQDYGYSFFAAGSSQKGTMVNCQAWGIKSGGLRVNEFDLTASDCLFRGRSGIIGQGVVVTGSGSDVSLSEVTIQDFNDSIVGSSVRTVKYSGIRIISCANPPAGTLLPQVASADPLNVRTCYQYPMIEVTGVADFGNVHTTFAGDVKVLKFTGGLNVFAGGNIAGMPGNFVAAADKTLTIACDGVKWLEISRSS